MSRELERLAATCLLPSFDGLEPPAWIRGLVDEGLGGVVLFSANVGDAEQLAALTATLHGDRAGVVIAIDEEGGDVARLERATGRSYPGNAALGAVDDVSATEAVARAMAADLGGAGVDLDLAPVADVNANPLNPVIGTRSFGADAELVARHTAAFVRGLQAGGVAACAKHFPGHGDTALDSHLALPAVDADREALHAGPLRPFRAAVAAGVRAVMTAHVVVPALDGLPATLSAELVEGVLRGELGFGGAVITDALDMAAIADGVGLRRGAVGALAAGADALCLGPTVAADAVPAIRAAIVDAVRDGSLPEDRLASAAERMRGLSTRPGPPLAVGDGGADLGLEVARRALAVEGEVALRGPPLVLELEARRSIASDPPRRSLGELLGGEQRRVREGDAVEVPAAGSGLVVVAHDAHRHAWQRRLVERLGPGAVVVETGLPHWRPQGVRGYVATFGSATVNLQAAAERLRGA